jgi:hypothetical protein
MMKLKYLLFIFSIQISFAEDAQVFSAKEVRNKNGQYCDNKTLVDIHAHAACIDDGGTNCYASSRMKKETVVLGLINKYESFFDAFGVSQEDLKTKGNEYFLST